MNKAILPIATAFSGSPLVVFITYLIGSLLFSLIDYAQAPAFMMKYKARGNMVVTM